MNVFALFMLAGMLLATIWAGRIEPWVATGIFFVAALLSDLTSTIGAAVSKYAQARMTEVALRGMAEGSVPQGVRDQIWRNAREAWHQTKGDSGKAD